MHGVYVVAEATTHKDFSRPGGEDRLRDSAALG
jgi:hypothetical protein